jgi:predicted RNase H-like nuclease (RuvC/YqgF family)
MSNNQTNSKPNEPEKKNLERKIIELTRNNNKLSSEVEVWRRKCNIIQDKYQSMRTLFDKDKFIGRPIREEENNINYPNYGTSK